MSAKPEDTLEMVRTEEQATRGRLRKEFLEELTYDRAGQRGSEEAFDKAIMTLCPAAFGLSIAFIHDLIGTKPLQYEWLLFASWIFFAISLLSIVVSFVTSRDGWRREQQIITDMYQWEVCRSYRREQLADGTVKQEQIDEEEKNADKSLSEINKSSKRTVTWNMVSAVCFSIAVPAFAMFSYLNMTS